MLIQHNTPVDLILEEYPESNKWLLEKHIHCTQCGEPVWGNICELIESKEMDSEILIEELNKYLKSCGY